VHDAPDTAHNFAVAGIFLQAESILIERLQEFLRALKEELPQLRGPIIGGVAQSTTSIL
jgi:hypothetical protein